MNQSKEERRGFKRVVKVALAFIGVCVFGALGIALFFGQTIQRKFDSARVQVDSHVTTGPSFYSGRTSSSPPSPSPAYVAPEPAKQAPAPAPVQEEPRYLDQAKPLDVVASERSAEGFIFAAQDPRSTFAADVDTGSYTKIRARINQGMWPYPSEVRPEEVVNYFGYSDPPPVDGPLSVTLEASPSLFFAQPDRYMLRVGVRGQRVEAKDRKPAHLVFLVDVSGSMSKPDKLPLAKQAMEMMVRQLRADDTVALVTYASGSRVVLEATSAKHKERIIAALDGLVPQGGTHMSDGMERAYKVASATYKRGHINRVIVLSDGDVNIGASNTREILDYVRAQVDQGVTLSTIGLGVANYNEQMMERLADTGNGNYYFIDNPAQARRVFVEQLTSTLQVIAKDVKLQVEFNPKAVKQYRLIGYENRAIQDEDFRDDKVDAGEIGAGHTVTAMYEVILNVGHEQERLAQVRVRYKAPEGQVAAEREFDWSAKSLKGSTKGASKDFQFSAAAVAFAEKLRCAPGAEKISWPLLGELAKGATDDDYPEREELVFLIKQVQSTRSRCK